MPQGGLYFSQPYPGARGEYVVEIATEHIISASFDYDRDTIEDVFLKLIEPNELGTSDTHYLKTVAGRPRPAGQQLYVNFCEQGQTH